MTASIACIGATGGALLGEVVNIESDEQKSQEQVEKYQQKFSGVAGMEAKIF